MVSRITQNWHTAPRDTHTRPCRKMPIAKLLRHDFEQSIICRGRKDFIGWQVFRLWKTRRFEGQTWVATCGSETRHQRKKDKAPGVVHAFGHGRSLDCEMLPHARLFFA